MQDRLEKMLGIKPSSSKTDLLAVVPSRHITQGDHSAITIAKEVSFIKTPDCVIVRIWASQFNGGEGVGHVTLETAENYISLWPAEAINGKAAVQITPKKHEFKASLNEDLTLERRPPEHQLNFYKLNAKAIDQEYERIVTSKDFEGYLLLGDIKLYETGGHNCASLAYYLLMKGGLKKLIGPYSSSSASGSTSSASNSYQSIANISMSSIISPDGLLTTIKKAKNIEEANKPKSKEVGNIKASNENTKNKIKLTKQANRSFFWCQKSTLVPVVIASASAVAGAAAAFYLNNTLS